MTNSQKEQITLLRQKGCSYAVIGEKLNLSKDTIKKNCFTVVTISPKITQWQN